MLLWSRIHFSLDNLECILLICKQLKLNAKTISRPKSLKKVFSSVITIMASNNFCPALVDRKPMLLPTHDFLAQIVAPKWYLAGLHSIHISAKKEGPSFEGGHLSFSCIDSAIVEAQTVTKKVAIRTGCIPSI